MIIDPRLQQIVAAQPYPLLFATISGAHLYGFPSPDSDFDLRGAHVLPLTKIAGLDVSDETIEDARIIESLDMDIVSHDVKKFMNLLLKKNGYVLEQLYSPLIVHTTPEHAELKSIAHGCINSQVTVPTLTLPSLLAGKLHILLTRRDREKGRDWYDYLWYRRNAVLPNVLQLQSAIAQTSDRLEARFWMSHLRARMTTVQWENIRHDVRPFLEYPDETTQLNERGLINLTRYPCFKEIVQELHVLKASHPLITKTENEPVLADLNQAALEGDLDAIEAQELIARLRA